MRIILVILGLILINPKVFADSIKLGFGQSISNGFKNELKREGYDHFSNNFNLAFSYEIAPATAKTFGSFDVFTFDNSFKDNGKKESISDWYTGYSFGVRPLLEGIFDFYAGIGGGAGRTFSGISNPITLAIRANAGVDLKIMPWARIFVEYDYFNFLSGTFKHHNEYAFAGVKIQFGDD